MSISWPRFDFNKKKRNKEFFKLKNTTIINSIGSMTSEDDMEVDDETRALRNMSKDELIQDIIRLRRENENLITQKRVFQEETLRNLENERRDLHNELKKRGDIIDNLELTRQLLEKRVHDLDDKIESVFFFFFFFYYSF